MPYQLAPFADVGLSPASLDALIAEHERARRPRLALLWDYYRNTLELTGEGARGGYRLAQQRGLPDRLFASGAIRGAGAGSGGAGGVVDARGAAAEIVIENDIAWRVHAMVDYLFGRPVRIVSLASDDAKRALIERVLQSAWDASGGMTLLQDAALLGHVHGYVDLVVRYAGAPAAVAGDAEFGEARAEGDDAIAEAARRVRIEVIDAPRGVPLVSPGDYRELDAYVLRWARSSPGDEAATIVTEVLSGQWRQVYAGPAGGGRAEGERTLVDQEPNLVSPGRVPVVHIQNLPMPLRYEGQSEVEPLVPLQDELNTRLSDRASRVTLQSFKMYLAKGLDGFEKAPVRPGTVWQTGNPDASIEAFGGDAASPSEESHIAEVREALDKISGVPPLATGVVQAKVGNLSSENALRLTLQGLLSKTMRKRLTYGRGIERVCELVLSALDQQGVLKTSAGERRVRLEWQDPLAGGESELKIAAAKRAWA